MTTQNNLLIRIDERQKDMSKDITDIKNRLGSLGDDYVSKVEFTIVNKNQDKRIGQMEKLIYGAFGLGLVTLGKAILELVVTVKAAQ